ncbi:MAG TPA: Ig-like domain-containing protein, partial [Gemmatimonadaceae bacterium]|nr:Ig-like domain-containing protein [Gemmatimonadaceae bacterium]
MRRSPAVRVWRELGPWVAAMVVGACADKALPPTGARSSVLSLRVRANVASQVGAATRLLSVHVGYKRPTSDTLISLATQEAQVTAGGTQQLSLSVDVSRCLADPARGGAGSVCPLQFAFSLLDANRVLLDSVDVGPINATPGVGSTAPLTVDLGNVATIAVTPDTGTVTAGGTVQVAGTARDAAGKVLAGRAIVYASSDTTIATVSRSGVVTTRTVGALTITASVGATAGVAQINVSPLVSSSLAASEFFTCALNVVGAAYCWGSDTFGQLGDGRSSAS